MNNDLFLLECEAPTFCFADDTKLIIHDRDKSNLISIGTEVMLAINKMVYCKLSWIKTSCIPFSISKANIFDVHECVKKHDSNCLD